MRAQSPKSIRGPKLALTAELVARVERTEPDPGPRPGGAYLTDDDFNALTRKLIADCAGEPLWIFAYGSLIWKPEGDFADHRRATAHGWHRAFTLKLERWRGTPDCPGLMMALDRGGACQGVILRLADKDPFAQLNQLLKREIDQQDDLATLRWVWTSSDIGKVRALTFYAGSHARYYAGKLSEREVAKVLARAAGHWGSCASYLFQTVTKLEEYGIHDTHLWKLQALVAEEIAKIK